MGSSKDTLFQSGGGSGAGAGDYVQDFFEDASVAATNNTGLTSTSSTNPLGRFLANTDFPRYEYKTLWVKRLVPLDQKYWINSKPTYEIKFTEEIPGVYAYAYGDCRLRNTQDGISVSVQQIDDGIGICGVARRVQFLINPVTDATANADIVVDGVDTATDANFNSQSLDVVSSTYPASGWNRWHAVRHGSSNETENIHDYRLTANQANLLTVSGFAVYFENTGNNIAIVPGSTYVDKIKQTTQSVTTMAVPAVTSPLGSNTLIYKTGANAYANIQNTIPAILSSATGTSGTALITVTTGHGASFPAGSGVVALQGSSFYVGSVVSVSTDTLTVTPTLAVALSGATFYKAWLANASLAIGASYYQQGELVDFGQLWTQYQVAGLANPADYGGTVKYFTGLEKQFRVWGQNVTGVQQDGYYGLAFPGASGVLNFEFYGAALSVELASQGGIAHGTFWVNSTGGWNLNQGITGIQKFTVFSDSGPQWHQVAFYPGASMSANVVFQNMQIFDVAPNQSQTTGHLASFDNLMSEVRRTAINATMARLGTHKRYFADDMYLTGGWARGVTTGAAGGVYYIGASTNCALRFEYFGQNFALLGSAASMNITLDGASIATQFGVGYSVGTMGFHLVTGTVAGAGMTAVIQGVDVIRPRDDVKTLQTFEPLTELETIPQVFQQSDTPRSPKNGDIWAENSSTGNIWLYLFNRWNKLRIDIASDDPNAPVIVVKSHGSTSAAAAGVTNTAEVFNQASWAAVTADSSSIWDPGTGNLAAYGFHHVSDGFNSGGSYTNIARRFNKNSWSAFTSRTARVGSGWVYFNNQLLSGCGSQSGPTYVATVDAWNNSSWTTSVVTLTQTAEKVGSFVEGGLARWVGGGDGGGRFTTHRTYNGVSASTSTANPTTSTWAGVSTRSGNSGLVSSGWDGSGSTTSYEWTGSWSANIATPVVMNSDNGPIGVAFVSPRSTSYLTNPTTASTPQNSVYAFINSSYSSVTASSTTRARTATSAL